MTEYLSQTLAITSKRDPRGRTWTRTFDPTEPKGAHAVEFSKTVAPCREGDTFERTLPRAEALGAGPSSLAPLGGGCGLRVRPDVPAPLSGSIRTVRSRASPGRHADAQTGFRSASDPLWRKANRLPHAGATANWSSSPGPHRAARAGRRGDQVVNSPGSNLLGAPTPSNGKGSPTTGATGGPAARALRPRPSAGNGACRPAGPGRPAARPGGRRRRRPAPRRRA
jgi:hypothetical protein